jgi:NAD+ kinase
MARVGILPHTYKPEARKLAGEITEWLRDRGHDPQLLAPEAAQIEDGLDLLVVLGGDGTMLHGIGLVGLSGLPVLGVNLGGLGFLTEVGADDALWAVERSLRGDHTIDERSTVEAMVTRSGGVVEVLGEGINEVSVERNVGGKVIRMTLTIGGQAFTTFGADGIIVATPTGSTAYAFSMRGPVVSPSLRCLDVVAVGAHALFDRPLVVADDQEVEIAVRFGGTGIVLIDGKPRTEIGEGDVLRAHVGPSVVRLVRLAPDSFFTRLARRFGLPEPH